jgi:hypothetical protein
MELPACASPSSIPWHVSRAAAYSSSSSCWEELLAACTACAWVVEFPKAVLTPENHDIDQIGSGSRMNQASM